MRVVGTIRMAFFPVFLSVVYVVRNQGHQLESIIHSASEKLSSLVTDYELIIVDNASDDESINVLKNLTGQSGYPNLQVYALTKEVDGDTASWVGLEGTSVNPLWHQREGASRAPTMRVLVF